MSKLQNNKQLVDHKYIVKKLVYLLKDWSRPTATVCATVRNRSPTVQLPVVWISKITKTSPVAVAPKMGQKTGLDRTFKH